MIYDAAADLCSHGVINGAIGKEPWLKDRYVRIRYQDVSNTDRDRDFNFKAVASESLYFFFFLKSAAIP